MSIAATQCPEKWLPPYEFRSIRRQNSAYRSLRMTLLLHLLSKDNMNLPNDSLLLELLPEFVEQWIIDVNQYYDQYIAEKNTKDMYRMGHTIKGACAQFGLPDMSQLGIQLTDYVKAENWEQCAMMKEPILSGFIEVKEFFDKKKS